ncbi:hypothetical protein PITC_078500 [Penicillium italicum]|uniref:Uncharacterized protein n=1 Tax=Penicillium italicum TaxID=40296 RepID=A0A0A2KXE0_PENIT|nr:hypothetical protein PITC_078500 [Penicillium italicum]
MQVTFSPDVESAQDFRLQRDRLIGYRWIRLYLHQYTRPKLKHGHVSVFSLFSCPPRGGRASIRTKRLGYGMIENCAQACRPEAPPVAPSYLNNWRGLIISSTRVCALRRSEHAWRGLREQPDANITTVQSTCSTVPVLVSDEPFECFIPHSIIAMVKG